MDEEELTKGLEELEKLPYDLYLDDVEGNAVDWPRGQKVGRRIRGFFRGRRGWSASRGRALDPRLTGDYETRYGSGISRKDPRLAAASAAALLDKVGDKESSLDKCLNTFTAARWQTLPPLQTDGLGLATGTSPGGRDAGPHSPSPGLGRKREREAAAARWERSPPSPRSPSPKRGTRSRERDRSLSPGRSRGWGVHMDPSPPPPPPTIRGRDRHNPRSRSPGGSPPRSRDRERSRSPRRDMWRPSPPVQRDAPSRPSGDVHGVPPPYSMQAYNMPAPPPPMYSENNYNTSVPPPANYNTNPGNYHSGYSQYGYDGYYQQPQSSYSGNYNNQSSGWQENSMMYPDVSLPPPVAMQNVPQPVNMRPVQGSQMSSGPGQQSGVDPHRAEEAKKEAIQNELLQQKQTLAKQREEYVKKAVSISRELGLLKQQEEELVQEDPRDTKAARFLKENHKLQLEIQNKLKAINNVIDMLTGIIGDEKERVFKAVQREERKASKKRKAAESSAHSDSDSDASVVVVAAAAAAAAAANAAAAAAAAEEAGSKRDAIKAAAVIAAVADAPTVPPPPPAIASGGSAAERQLFNYVYYDPEMHWCRVCNVFPRTAKEFLNHLHSSEHKKETLERKLVDMPWHSRQTEEDTPVYKNAPNRRTPIRGLQFFISVTAWYCKLCNTWIGDLHCASLHLKSKTHRENYASFTEQNPHWETDWLADREQAYERRGTLGGGGDAGSAAAAGVAASLTGPSRSMTDELPLTLPQKAKSKAARHLERAQRKQEKRALAAATGTDEEKKKKKRKKRRKKKAKARTAKDSTDSSWSSTSSSSSSSSSSDDEEDVTVAAAAAAAQALSQVGLAAAPGALDRTKSIRIAMRSRDRPGLQTQTPVAAAAAAAALELRSKWESPERGPLQLPRPPTAVTPVTKETTPKPPEDSMKKPAPPAAKPAADDRLLKEWAAAPREVVTEGEKQILNNIKERVKQKQEAKEDREREKEKEKERSGERERDRDRDRDRERDRERERERYPHHGYYERRGRGRRSESPAGGGGYREHGGRGMRRSGRAGRSPGDRRWGRYDRSYERPGREAADHYHERRRGGSRESRGREERVRERERERERGSPAGPPPPSRLRDPADSRRSSDSDENAESKFEKQTAEAAAKLLKRGAKVPVMTLPKTKLPFIGRMPILKKLATKKKADDKGDKGDEDGKEGEEGDEESQGKTEGKDREGGPVGIRDDLPPGDDDMVATGPPNAEVLDMDIDEEEDASNPGPPGVNAADREPSPPRAPPRPPPAVMQLDSESTPEPKKSTEVPLPKDFQDALNILFPAEGEGGEGEGGEGRETSPSKLAAAQAMWQGMPPGMMYPPNMGYGQMMGGMPPQMMYGPPTMMPRMTGPPPYGMMGPPPPRMPVAPPLPPPPGEPMASDGEIAPEPEGMEEVVADVETELEPEPAAESPPKRAESAGQMTQEDLAMLGIDAEDMAAQSF